MEDKDNILDEAFKEDSIVKKEKKEYFITPFIFVCPLLIFITIWLLIRMPNKDGITLYVGSIFLIGFVFSFVIDRILTHILPQKILVFIESFILVSILLILSYIKFYS